MDYTLRVRGRVRVEFDEEFTLDRDTYEEYLKLKESEVNDDVAFFEEEVASLLDVGACDVAPEDVTFDKITLFTSRDRLKLVQEEKE